MHVTGDCLLYIGDKFKVCCLISVLVLFQHDIYEGTTKNLIQDVIQGYNVTVFAYGATGKENIMTHDDILCFRCWQDIHHAGHQQ